MDCKDVYYNRVKKKKDHLHAKNNKLIVTNAQLKEKIIKRNKLIIIIDKEKANLFRKMYALTSKKPKVNKSERFILNNTKCKIIQYISSKNRDPISNPFTIDELNADIKYLHRRKACGSDRIFSNTY